MKKKSLFLNLVLPSFNLFFLRRPLIPHPPHISIEHHTRKMTYSPQVKLKNKNRKNKWWENCFFFSKNNQLSLFFSARRFSLFSFPLFSLSHSLSLLSPQPTPTLPLPPIPPNHLYATSIFFSSSSSTSAGSTHLPCSLISSISSSHAPSIGIARRTTSFPTYRSIFPGAPPT